MVNIPNIFEAALLRMRDLSILREEEWNAWAVKANIANDLACELHQQRLALDPAASIRASYAHGGQMQAVYQQCKQCAEDERTRQRSDALREAGVFDGNLLHATLDNFVCRTDTDRSNLESARAFVARGKGFLLLLGTMGTGKSHLAVAIMRAMSCRARFTTQAALLRRLRETYRDAKAEDVVETCKRVRLLVLDELGVSGGGKDELPMLHEILSTRHGERKPTVLTSNLAGEDELQEVLGERMNDRLRQSGFAKLYFRGESLRRTMRKEY